MTLQEILNSIMLRYPHALDNETVVGMINDVQKRLFRTIYRNRGASAYDIAAGLYLYPIDFSPENIIDVVVNDEEYPYQDIKYNSNGPFYYVYDGSYVGIYPTPTEDIDGGLVIFRYDSPTVLTTNDMSLSPDFDSAFHMMIVYEVCKNIAEIALDTSMANVFVTQYTTLEKGFNKSRKAKPYEIVDVYGGCNW